MLKSFEDTLTNWNRNTSDRQKLQHTYAVLLIVVVFLAGIVSLFSSQRSDVLLYVAFILLIGFFANYLIWSLLTSWLIGRLPRQTRRPRSAQKSARR